MPGYWEMEMAHFFAASLDRLSLRAPSLHAQDKYMPGRTRFLFGSSIDRAPACTGAYSDLPLPPVPYGIRGSPEPGEHLTAIVRSAGIAQPFVLRFGLLPEPRSSDSSGARHTSVQPYSSIAK